MKTFQNGISKDWLVRVSKEHVQLDMLMQGAFNSEYGHKFQACSLGCIVKSINEYLATDYDYYSFQGVAEAIGTAVFCEKMREFFFENLEGEDHIIWHLDYANSIPENVDLAPVMPRYLDWLISELMKNTYTKEVDNALVAVKYVLVDWVENGNVDAKAVIRAEEMVREATEATGAATGATKAAIEVAESVLVIAEAVLVNSDVVWASSMAARAARWASWMANAEWAENKNLSIKAQSQKLLQLISECE